MVERLGVSMTLTRPQAGPYQAFMLALCAYTLLALAFEFVLQPDPDVRALLDYADVAVCALFFVDFWVSLFTADNRWRYLATWGWLDLLSSIPALDAARWGRAARVARILRVLRGVRATKVLSTLVLAKRSESVFLATALVTLLLLFTASVSILQVEVVPESNIRTADDALWWALTTMTTVGYGDRFPVTSEGRAIAGVLMCAGVGVFGTFSGLLAAWFVTPSMASEASDVDALRHEVRRLSEAVDRLTDRAAGPAAAPSTDSAT